MEGAIFQEGRTWTAVQRDAALMSGNPYAHLEQRGISLHLAPWSAVLCRGVPWLASGFPGGIWIDSARICPMWRAMKFHHDGNENIATSPPLDIVSAGRGSFSIVQNDGHSRACTGARGWRDCQGTPRVRPTSEAVIFWGRGYWAFSSARRVHFLLFLRQNLHYLWDTFRMFPQRFQKLFIGHAVV